MPHVVRRVHIGDVDGIHGEATVGTRGQRFDNEYGQGVGGGRMRNDGIGGAGRGNVVAVAGESLKMESQRLGRHFPGLLNGAPSGDAAGEVGETHTVVAVRFLVNQSQICAFQSHVTLGQGKFPSRPTVTCSRPFGCPY